MAVVIARTSDWLEMNQRSLSRSIADVRAALARHAARSLSADAPSSPRQEPQEGGESGAPIRPVGSFALDDLAAAFGLTPFERDVVLLCAGVELDAGVASDCERAHGSQRSYPTFGLALAALPGAHWSALPSNCRQAVHRVHRSPAGPCGSTSASCITSPD
jgi:hypothetical protein